MYFKDKNPSIQSFKLGFFFFLLFSAVFSFQNVVTHVYEQRGLTAVGPLILISNYLTFLVASTLAVNSKISFKIQFIVASLLYTFNLVLGIFIKSIQSTFIVYFIVTISAMAAGGSAGYMWVGQGGYLREICRGRENKGKYNGIFTLMYSLSQVMAGIVTTFFLGLFSEEVYFITLTIIGLLSTLFAIFFLEDISQLTHVMLQNKQKQKTNQKQTQQQQISSQITHSDQVPVNQQQQIPNSSPKQMLIKQQNIKQNMIKSLQFYSQMIPLLIFLIMDGILLSIQSNQIPKLIVKENDQSDSDFNLKVGILNITMGVGSLISSSLNGVICDKLGLKMAGNITLGFFAGVCIFTAIQATFLQQLWFGCIITLTWGFSYFLFEGFIYVVLLKIYQGKLQAFAINKQMHCISMAAFQIFVILTNNRVDLQYLMYFIILLVIPAFYSLSKINFDKQGKLNYSQNERKKEILESLIGEDEE